MLSSDELCKLAKCRFEEAKILADNKRPDGASYLCGYALELILKRKIVLLLDWTGYPETGNEFNNNNGDLRTYKTHDLSLLLQLSGLEKRLLSDTALRASWQVAKSWQAEQRYSRVGNKSKGEVDGIIEETRTVINWILKN